METAKANIPPSGSFEKGNTSPSSQQSLSMECIDKASSYEEGSPPIHYVKFGAQKAADQPFNNRRVSHEINLCYSSPESARIDEDKDGEGSFLQGVGLLRAVELSANSELVYGQSSPIPSLYECVSSSCVTEMSKNVVTTSAQPLFLAGTPPEVVPKKVPEITEIGDDDDDDRPLIVDLGDSFTLQTSPDHASTSPKAFPRNSDKLTVIPEPVLDSPCTVKSITVSNSPQIDTLAPYLDATNSKIPPTCSVAPQPALLKVKSSIPAPISTNNVRVQKPIRPFFAPTITTFDQHNLGHHPATLPVFCTTSSAMMSSTASTFRFHPAPPSNSLLPPPSPLSAVHFMSVLTPGFGRGPMGLSQPISSNTVPSGSSSVSAPIQLLNLGSLPSYFNAASSGMYFQHLAGGIPPSNHPPPHNSPANSPHFATPAPPPLFPSCGPPQHQQPPPTSQFGPPPMSATSSGAKIMPTPPPLSPAPGLAQQHPSMGLSRLASSRDRDMTVTGLAPPLGGIILGDWMTAPQAIPTHPTPPLFASSPHHIISQATLPPYSHLLTSSPFTSIFVGSNGGEPIYTSSPCQLPTTIVAPQPQHSPLFGNIPTACTVTTISSADVAAAAATASGGVAPMAILSAATASRPLSPYSVSARRWRPPPTNNGTTRRKDCVGAITSSIPSTSVFPIDRQSPSNSIATAISTPVTVTMATKPSNALSPVIMVDTEIRANKQPKAPETYEITKPIGSNNSAPSIVKRKVSDPDYRLWLPSMPTEDTPKWGPSKTAAIPPTPSPRRKSSTVSAPALAKPLQKQQQQRRPSPLSLASSMNSSVGVQRKIISHFIDGHVLYESNLPFPVRDGMSVVEATLRQPFLSSPTEDNKATPPSPPTNNKRGTPATHDTLHPTDPPKPSPPARRSTGPRRPAVGPNRRKRRSSFVAASPLPPSSTASVGSAGVAVTCATDLIGVNETAETATTNLPTIEHSPITTGCVSKLENAASSGAANCLKLTIYNQQSPIASSGSLKPSPHSPQPPPTLLPPPITSIPEAASLTSTLPFRPNGTERNFSSATTPALSSPSRVPLLLSPPPSAVATLPEMPVCLWSSERVAEFVRATPSCGAYAETFQVNEIDGEALLLLSLAQFTSPPISMKIGHALKLVDRLRQLKPPLMASSLM